MKQPLLKLLVLTSLGFSIGLENAHAEGAASAEQLTRQVVEGCPKSVAPFINRRELEPVMAARAVDISAVCNCFALTFAKDSRLQALFKRKPSEFALANGSPKFKAYITLRMMTSVFSCLLPEFEATLSASDPE